jgi:hypothetical protein
VDSRNKLAGNPANVVEAVCIRTQADILAMRCYFLGAATDLAAARAAQFAMERNPLSCACFWTSASRLWALAPSIHHKKFREG